jgi:hypothetical protein
MEDCLEEDLEEEKDYTMYCCLKEDKIGVGECEGRWYAIKKPWLKKEMGSEINRLA